MNMTLHMISMCKEKTLKRTHTAADLSSSEKSALTNCMLKFLEAPQIVMNNMQAQGGGAPGGF